MSASPVEAVFFWRFTKDSVYKPVYGRGVDSDSYTKDYLQADSDVARALQDCFGEVPTKGDEVDFVWRAPGGEALPGKVKRTTDRLNLRWPTHGAAPSPWRVTNSPDPRSGRVILGEPGYRNEQDANAQLTAIRERGDEPWLVAVKIVGERALHARSYLENPPASMPEAGTSQLPEQVREAMRRLPAQSIGGVVSFSSDTPTVRATSIVTRVLSAFRRNRNVLLVGPPGTGKSVALEDLRGLFEGQAGPLFDPDATENAWTTPDVPDGEGKVRSLVMHPSFSYEDLVIGLLPKPEGGAVGIEPHVGPLLSLAHYASQEGHKALLILDEFNRGNAAAAFGDTLALLDTDKRSTNERRGAVIDTPFAHLNPQVGEEFSRNGDARDRLEPLTSLPDNLYIVAAMNSADRSVAPLDAALRRRFEIIHVDPDYHLLRVHLHAEGPLPTGADEFAPAHVGELAVRVLEAVNERIEFVLGRDFLLGHALLWSIAADIEQGSTEVALRSLARAFDERIVATLRLTFTDQDEHLSAVLGDRDTRPVAFARWQTPPPELEPFSTRRLVFEPLHDQAPEVILEALRLVAGIEPPRDDEATSG